MDQTCALDAEVDSLVETPQSPFRRLEHVKLKKKVEKWNCKQESSKAQFSNDRKLLLGGGGVGGD